jgi:ferredoxin
MNIDVDRERCEGHGLCEAIAPAVFELDDEGLVSIAPEIPAGETESVAAAVRTCPVAALRIRS